MAMSYILAAFFVLALVCGGLSRPAWRKSSAAAMEGAGAAVELCLSWRAPSVCGAAS